MACSEDGVEQQEDPNPWISSTGDWLAWPEGADPAEAGLGGPATPIAAWAREGPRGGDDAPAKPARATPMTSPMASTAATGATGRRRVTGRQRRAGRWPGSKA